MERVSKWWTEREKRGSRLTVVVILKYTWTTTSAPRIRNDLGVGNGEEKKKEERFRKHIGRKFLRLKGREKRKTWTFNPNSPITSIHKATGTGNKESLILLIVFKLFESFFYSRKEAKKVPKIPIGTRQAW